IGVLVPLYGLAGLTLTPLWIWLGTGWYGYGAIWSIDTLPAGLLCLPQGAVILAAGLSVAPWLRRVDAHFARLFLAPTRAAELRLRVTQLTVPRADAQPAGPDHGRDRATGAARHTRRVRGILRRR